MDNKGIDVVQLQILQRGFQVGLHMLGPVIGVPQLGLDEEILALHHALGKQLLQGLADDVLVVVVVGAVDQAVSTVKKKCSYRCFSKASA